MKKIVPFAALLALLAAAPAWAADGGQSQLLQIGPLNEGHLTIRGSGNWVSLYQDMPADALDGNSALIQIRGNGNGGAGGGSLFSGLGIGEALVPGRISQSGTGNQLALSVIGNDNVFALSQDGADNSLRGVIRGAGNEVAALQRGVGNVLGFSQVGTGNMLSVTQISR